MSNEAVGNVNPELIMDAITKKNVGDQVQIGLDQVNHLMKTVDARCQILKNKRTYLLLDVKEGLNTTLQNQAELSMDIDNEIMSLAQEQVLLSEFAEQTETNYEIFKKELTEIYLSPTGICPEFSRKMRQILQNFELVKSNIAESMNLQVASLQSMFKFLQAHKEFFQESQEANSQNLMCLEYAHQKLEREINKVKCDLMESYEAIWWTLLHTKKYIDGEQHVTCQEENHGRRHNLLAEHYDAQKKNFHSTLEGLVNEIQALVRKGSGNKCTEQERAKKNRTIVDKLDTIKMFAKRFACPVDEESNEELMDQE